jgi:predicted nucleotidyltransferase
MHPVGFAAVSVELLEEIVRRIVHGVQPEKIILFGSYAFGNPTPDSDLDLLVIVNTEDRPPERTLAVSRLLRPRPFPMDILVRTPQEVAIELEKEGDFMQEVISQGMVIYERNE